MMNRSMPINVKIREISLFTFRSLLEETSSYNPNEIVKIIKIIRIVFRNRVSGYKCHIVTNAIPSPLACPKIGSSISNPTIQSKIPNSSCWNFCFCLFLSFSAIEINSRLESNSSIEISKTLEIALSDSILGNPLPDSHFETAVLEINSLSANSLSTMVLSINHTIIEISFSDKKRISRNIADSFTHCYSLFVFVIITIDSFVNVTNIICS